MLVAKLVGLVIPHWRLFTSSERIVLWEGQKFKITEKSRRAFCIHSSAPATYDEAETSPVDEAPVFMGPLGHHWPIDF
jgi:hypothetical protein